jgi:hypothetical protein
MNTLIQKGQTMNWNKLIIAFAILGCLTAARAQFDSGSTGTVALVVNTGTTNTINLPPNGVLHYTTITIRSNGTLRFGKNALNTPAVLLARSNVLIEGTIDVSGSFVGTNRYVGGEPGPGGFAGGAPGYLQQAPGTNAPAGNGLGPGGGNPLSGPGSQRNGFYAYNLQGGPGYGYPHLIPLVGGSGGGGTSNSITGGGGGGGGAILIASSTRIQVNTNGLILANGGSGTNQSGAGSGGAIRLVAPMVLGNGKLDVTEAGFPLGYPGRVRIDSTLRYDPADPTNPTNQFSIMGVSSANPGDPRVWSVGATMIVFPTNQPRLDIVQVGPFAIPESTNNSVSVQLPSGADTNQLVTVQARDFNALITINVVVTPENGTATLYTADIDNSTNPARIDVPVVLPLNTRAFINAWKR